MKKLQKNKKQEKKSPCAHFSASEIFKLDERVVKKMCLGRKFSGIPWIITSGYRTKKENEKIGGAKNSLHLKGMAIDVKAKKTKEKFLILLSGFKAGFTGFGIYPNHIHLDIGKKRFWIVSSYENIKKKIRTFGKNRK